MITRIRLENYACIKDCEIELKPITILVGDNASGKTMIINALLQMVDIITGSQFARIPLEETARTEPETTTIETSFNLYITLRDLIALLITIVLELAYKRQIEIPDRETLIKALGEHANSEKEHVVKFIDKIINVLCRLTKISEKLYKENTDIKRIIEALSIILTRIPDNTITSLLEDSIIMVRLLLKLRALLLVLGLEESYIQHLINELSKNDNTLEEQADLIVRIYKKNSKIMLREFSINLRKLHISYISRPQKTEIIFHNKRFVSLEPGNDFVDIKSALKHSSIVRCVLSKIDDELSSSWNPEIETKKLIFVPGFRLEPHLFIPYFEVRTRVERFPLSDLYIVQVYDKDRLDYFAEDIGYDSFRDLLKNYFDIDDIEIEVTDIGVRIIVKRGKLKSSLASSGSGTYYVIPIVLACSLLDYDSILIVEHPELYLNPRYQSRLLDLFIDISMNKRCKIIIETHSPFMIYRVLRRVAEGKINSEDVAIYYLKLDKEIGHTKIIKIEIDKTGIPKVWPEGLFEEDLEDALTIMSILMNSKNVLKREF